MDHTYEGSENFTPFPTNYLTLCHKMSLTSFPGLPAFDPMQLVHAEERLTIFKALKFDVNYQIKETVVDVLDKKQGTNVIIETLIKEEKSKQRVASVYSGMYIRGMMNSEARIKLRGVKVCPDLEREMGGSGKIDLETEFQTE